MLCITVLYLQRGLYNSHGILVCKLYHQGGLFYNKIAIDQKSIIIRWRLAEEYIPKVQYADRNPEP